MEYFKQYATWLIQANVVSVNFHKHVRQRRASILLEATLVQGLVEIVGKPNGKARMVGIVRKTEALQDAKDAKTQNKESPYGLS